MRIAFLLNHWPVLSQTFVMNQVTGLIDRGHEVDIYAKSPGRAPVVHADVGEYGLLDRTLYYGTASERLPANKALRLAKAAGQLIAHVHRKPMPLLRSLNFLRFGRAAASLGLFHKTLPFVRDGAHKHDIVYCHFGRNGNLAALLKQVGAITGRIVTTFHGEAGYTGRERYEKGYDLLFEIGDLMLPMSERERQNLIELGCSPHKIVVHRMGVDLSKFAFAPRRSRNDGAAHLLTVARLVEKKGVAYGIRAVANVLERHPHIEYRIAGDGPLRNDLEDLIDTLGIGGKVKILGWRRQEEIVALMKEADILLAPSVTSEAGDQEGIPVVLMEALAQGLPVLSTYHSGIPELVRDGESGFLVPERDADALAEKLAHLVSHPEIWPLMGESGRKYVERHYDVDKLNDRLAELFQRLLDGELP